MPDHARTVGYFWPVTKLLADNYRHQGMRRRLVQLLREKSIHDETVLAAIGTVPRHLFIDDTAFTDRAYEDAAFPIGCGQTISQPYTVAFQSELLQLSPGMKVLEIGTGSGYQCAVLCAMKAKMFSIERQRPLYLMTRERLGKLGFKANLTYGDGYAGIPREAPFDRVIVTCGAAAMPETLLDQLKPGGRAVIPVGEGNDQRMLLVIKNLDGSIMVEEKGRFRFVPMLADKAS